MSAREQVQLTAFCEDDTFSVNVDTLVGDVVRVSFLRDGEHYGIEFTRNQFRRVVSMLVNVNKALG